MRNLIIFGIFVMVLVFVQFAQAQSVDDIVKKNIEAMGGKDKLSTLKTAKLEGMMTVQGTEINITTTKMHMKGLRMDIDVSGVSNYQMANTTKGTVFMPVAGMTEPTEMQPEQFQSAQHQMDIQGALFNYKEKGSKLELVGVEEVSGSPAHKIKITYKSGVEGFLFVDMKTNRVVKSVSKTVVNGQSMDLESVFSDFKQNDAGYWFPYTVVSTQGTINYSKIQTNVDVDEKIFTN